MIEVTKTSINRALSKIENVVEKITNIPSFLENELKVLRDAHSSTINKIYNYGSEVSNKYKERLETFKKVVEPTYINKFLQNLVYIDKKIPTYNNVNDGILRDLDKKTMKYKRPVKNEYFKKFGNIWGLSLEIYYGIIPDLQKIKLKNYLNKIQTPDDYELQKYFKEIGNYEKRKGDEGREYFYGMDLFGGYQTKKDEGFVNDIIDWVSGYRDNRVGGEFGNYLTIFTSKVLELCCSNINTSEEVTSVKTFLESGKWVTTGGTTLKNGKIDGIKVPNNKRWNYWSKDLNELENEMYSKQTIKNTVVQKLELGKVRPIVSGDTQTFFKMSFLNEYIYPVLRSNKIGRKTPLFMSDRSMISSYTKTVESIILGNGFHTPIDQSEFDHGPAKEKILIIIKILCYIAITASKNDPEVELIANTLLAQFPDQVIEYDNRTYNWNGGVLSGWRWTSLLDTIINLADLEVAKELAEVKTQDDNALGDDTKFKTETFDESATLVYFYRYLGLDINTSKFWISKVRDEFLRLVSSKKGTIGYPARALPGNLFIKPLLIMDDEFREDKIRDRVEGWNRLVTRGCDKNRCYYYLLDSINTITKMRKSDISLLLHTPASLGGYGIYPYVFQGTNTIVREQAVRQAMSISAPSWLAKYGVSKIKKLAEVLDKAKYNWKSRQIVVPEQRTIRLAQWVRAPTLKDGIPVGLLASIIEQYDDFKSCWENRASFLSDESYVDSLRFKNKTWESKKFWLNNYKVGLPLFWGVGVRFTANTLSDTRNMYNARAPMIPNFSKLTLTQLEYNLANKHVHTVLKTWENPLYRLSD